MTESKITLFFIVSVVFMLVLFLFVWKGTNDICDTILSLRPYQSRSKVIVSGVTLQDVCKLCPNTELKVANNDCGITVIDTSNIAPAKFAAYQYLYITKMNGDTQTLEVSDPSLL